MSGAKIHPHSRLGIGSGRASQKGLQKHVRSRSLTSSFTWSGRSTRKQKAKDLCTCPEHGPELEPSTSLISSFVPPSSDGKGTRRKWLFGRVVDPQSRSIKKINRMVLLACTLGMFIDPLFLDTLTIDDRLSCLYVDERYVLVVTVLRAMVDAMYLWHIVLQLKLAYTSKNSIVPGRGELVWDARDVALHYLCALRGFVFDVFVILPIPQVMLWVVVPHFVRQGGDVKPIMSYMLLAFLFQYIPKVFHIFLIIRRMQRVTGYVFGTAIWGFGLNLICYMIASHVAGSVWYLLGIQRVERCIQDQCMADRTVCQPSYMGCPLPIASPGSQPISNAILEWSQGLNVTTLCLGSSSNNNYDWGIFAWAVPLATTTNAVEKIVFQVFWGVMTVSSFGNALTPSNNLVEATFCVIVIITGLLMFTLLIGNIQVFLHSHTSKKEEMQLKMRDIEWCMRRRQLPPSVRHRVRQSEREKWAATRGVDEAAMISELPEGLRRDIKRHLCVDLVRRVPLFDQMDELVINNICDRLKPLIYIKGEKIVDEGDPVLRMLFVARGFVRSAYRLHNGNTSSCVLGPGNFAGDELVPWCFRKQVGRLPSSTATLSTLNDVELFALDAGDLRYITEHFRYKFDKKKLKNTARYWSSSWRTWAAVTVQLAWRRFKQERDITREKEKQGPLKETFHFPLTVTDNERLRLYTAMMCSPKPQDYMV